MKTNIVRVAYEEFAKDHKGETLTAQEINDGVKELLTAAINMCVSDFAQPETDFPRSKYNKELFERIKIGVYKVK